jgi:hypothetical protein
MISTERLVAWAKAEGLTAEEETLRECEKAAVDYVNRVTGRYFGAESELTEEFRWRGGVLDLSNVPVDLTLEQWTGSAWEEMGTDDYRVSGRLVYLSGSYALGGTPIRATYTAGYEVDPGDDDAWDAPPVVQQAVRMLTMHWYVNRGDGIASSTTPQLEEVVMRMLQVI